MGMFTSTLLLNGVSASQVVAAFRKHRRKSVIIDLDVASGTAEAETKQVLVLDKALSGVDKYESVRQVLTEALAGNADALVAYTNIHDDDVLITFVTRIDAVVDEFMSNPEYLGVSDEEREKYRGGQNWLALAVAYQRKENAEALRAVMHPATSDAYVFESDRLLRMSELLGWPGELLTTLTYEDFLDENSELVANIPATAIFRTGVRKQSKQ
ncbi:MAG: hypothetical protein H7Z40_14795 [Phycisphaerae bacterium]|nr:hypothetical protein [Gemmatimonadaceae bacterium]